MRVFLSLLILLLNVISLYSQGSGNVLTFNGSDRYVNLGTSVGNNTRTLEFWFKPTNTINSTIGDAISLIMRDYDNGSGVNLNEFGFYFTPTGWAGMTGGSLVFYRRVNSTLYAIQSNNNTWQADTWYHVAGVLDPTSGMKMYVNGVLQNDTDPSTEAVLPQPNIVTEITTIGTWGYWGAFSGNRFFSGDIDEVRFWDYARNQTEIRNKMCSKLIGTETGLKAYYKFDNTTGTTLSDNTSSFAGTLINFPVATNPWHYSSAPIGDTSVYIYPGSFSGVSLNLQYATGDDFSVNSITGNSAGAHIYRENSFPNSTLGLNTNTNSNYYGVFLTGTNGGYNFDYNTGYLSNCSSNCTKIFNRNDNDNLTWLELSTTNNTCVHSKQNESGNENSFREEYIVSSSSLSFDLGNDTSICSGSNLVLAPNITGVSYLWSTGDSSSSINILSSGTYWLQLSDGSCSGRDTIIVNFVNTTDFNLGNDTSFCQGSSYPLVGPNGYSYFWNNNSGQQSINVTSSGVYWLEASINGCSEKDSINIIVNPKPFLNLGNDTSLCNTTSYALDGSTTNCTYLWNDNTTNATNLITHSGQYYLEITNLNGCRDQDTINIIFSTYPALDLGPDISLCANEVLNLNTGYIAPFTCLWSTNSHAQSIQVSSSGLYWAEVNNNGCSSRDSLEVNIKPLPEIPNNDTIICRGASLTLDAGEENSSFLWNTGDTLSTIIIYNPGVYSVVVTKNGCIKRQEIGISSFNTSDSSVTISACNQESIVLKAPSYEGVVYNWNTSATTPTIEVSENGDYQVIITSDNCFAQKKFTVSGLKYSGGVFIPNTFTPNDDYINQTFFVEAEIITKYKLEIYNKWGENIYVSEDKKEGWKGLYKNQLVKNDTYIYVLTYEEMCDQGITKQKKGIINLIR